MRYIGNKTQLLSEIKNVIDKKNIKANSFCDIFSGTGSVARFFKDSYEIYSNDILYLSYVLQMATIENDCLPSFDKLHEYLGTNVFEFLNNIDSNEKVKYDEDKLFIRNNYSDFCGRNYLTQQNAKIVDYWRLTLEQWKNKGLISKNEYFYLLACIIETIPFYSNISGTYGAFLKSWDQRALKRIKLVELEVPVNGRNNKCFNESYATLLDKISGDILYIDPPYNERQYLPNYHLLETIAKYDYPVIKGKTGIRDYKEQKSDFCIKSKALLALEELISKAKFKYILFSYNTDGLMSESDICKILEKYSKNGQCEVTRIPYRRFKSRTLVNTSELCELIFFIEKDVI